MVLASKFEPRGSTRISSLGLWKVCHSAWMCTSHCSVCVFKGKLWSLSRSLSCLHLFYYKLIRCEFSLLCLHFHAVWLGTSPDTSYTWISPVLLFYTVQVSLLLGMPLLYNISALPFLTLLFNILCVVSYIPWNVCIFLFVLQSVSWWIYEVRNWFHNWNWTNEFPRDWMFHHKTIILGFFL